MRALLQQPEAAAGTWRAARAEAPDLIEGKTRDALHRLDPLWNELFPAEQARIVRALVEHVVVASAGKTVVTPMAEGVAPITTRIAPALKALARTFRCQRMLDEGGKPPSARWRRPNTWSAGILTRCSG
jgi:hypothetical protein